VSKMTVLPSSILDSMDVVVFNGVPTHVRVSPAQKPETFAQYQERPSLYFSVVQCCCVLAHHFQLDTHCKSLRDVVQVSERILGITLAGEMPLRDRAAKCFDQIYASGLCIEADSTKAGAACASTASDVTKPSAASPDAPPKPNGRSTDSQRPPRPPRHRSTLIVAAGDRKADDSRFELLCTKHKGAREAVKLVHIASPRGERGPHSFRDVQAVEVQKATPPSARERAQVVQSKIGDVQLALQVC